MKSLDLEDGRLIIREYMNPKRTERASFFVDDYEKAELALKLLASVDTSNMARGVEIVATLHTIKVVQARIRQELDDKALELSNMVNGLD